MTSRSEASKLSDLTEAFERQKAASVEQQLAGTALRSLLNTYNEQQILVRVVGFPFEVAYPFRDDSGNVIARTVASHGDFRSALASNQPEVIEEATVIYARKLERGEVISVRSAETDISYSFDMDGVIEISPVEPSEEVAPRIQTQRAILGAVNSGLMSLETHHEA